MVSMRCGIGILFSILMCLSGCIDVDEKPLYFNQKLPNNHDLFISTKKIENGMIRTEISIDGNVGSIVPIDTYDMADLASTIREKSWVVENPTKNNILVLNHDLGLVISKGEVVHTPHNLNSCITYILNERPNSNYIQVSYKGDESYVYRGLVENTVGKIFNLEEFRLRIRGPKGKNVELGVIKNSANNLTKIGVPYLIGEDDREIAGASLDMASLRLRGRYSDNGENVEIQMSSSGAEWVKHFVEKGEVYVQITPKSGVEANYRNFMPMMSESRRQKYLEGGPWTTIEDKNPDRIFTYTIQYRNSTANSCNSGSGEYEVAINGNYDKSTCMKKTQLDDLVYTREKGYFMMNMTEGKPGALLCHQKNIILTSECARYVNPITYVFTGDKKNIQIPFLTELFVWNCQSELFYPHIIRKETFRLVFSPPDPKKDNILIIKKEDGEGLTYCGLISGGSEVCGLKFPELVPEKHLMILYKPGKTELKRVEGGKGNIYVPSTHYEPIKFELTDPTVSIIRYCMDSGSSDVSNALDIFIRKTSQPLSPDTKIYEERAPNEDDPDLHTWKYESSGITVGETGGITIMHRKLHPLEISAGSNYDAWGRRLKGSGDFEVVVNSNMAVAFRCPQKKREDVSHANKFGIPVVLENKRERMTQNAGIVDISAHLLITPELVTQFNRVVVEFDPLGSNKDGLVPSIVLVHRESHLLLQIAEPMAVFKTLFEIANSGPVKIVFRDVDEQNPKSLPITLKRDAIDEIFDIHGGPMIEFEEDGKKDAKPTYRESNHLDGITIDKDSEIAEGRYKYDQKLAFKKKIHPHTISAMEYFLSTERLKTKLPIIITDKGNQGK